MLDRRLIERAQLLRLYREIEPQLIRYPAIEPRVLEASTRAITHPKDSLRQMPAMLASDLLESLPGQTEQSLPRRRTPP